MITAGIDVGLEKIKLVILKDGKILVRGEGMSGGGGRAGAIERVWRDTLKAASLAESDIDKVTATGQGMYDVNFANSRVTEPIADAKAARFLYPNAASVVDIGADQTRVVTLGEGECILEVALNQKCSAGLGVFLKYMARRLGMTIEEISGLSPAQDNGVFVNEGCSVFMELEALERLFQDVPREDVARAIIDAVAVRLNSILNDKIKPAKDSTILIGGVSKNAALINALKIRSGINFIIPKHAEYCGALGAALLAEG